MKECFRNFWDSKYGPFGAFTYNAPNDDGNVTGAYTCQFANEPLSWEMVADWVCSVGVASSPTYSPITIVTRFTTQALNDALLAQLQQVIPLIKIQPLQAGYPASSLSDRRCTVSAQLYLPRPLDFDGISESMGNEADQAKLATRRLPYNDFGTILFEETWWQGPARRRFRPHRTARTGWASMWASSST